MYSTEKIEKLLKEADNIDVFFESYGDQLVFQPFYEYALQVIAQKNLRMSDVINKSCLSKSTIYKLLSGERNPNRDTIIHLAFGIGLSIEESNRMLKLASHSPLSVRNKREAIIIFCINQKKDLIDTDQLIESLGFETLTSQF